MTLYEKRIAAQLKAEMAPSVRKGIVLVRSGAAAPLDGPGESYFGGLPRLPPDVEWPTMEFDSPESEPVPLTFVGQIRLDDLPHLREREALPSTGMLYFFQFDPLSGLDSLPCKVLFHPNSEPFAERAPPAGLPRLVRYEELGIPEKLKRRIDFRYPISFAVADTYVDHEDLARYPSVMKLSRKLNGLEHGLPAAELLLEEFRAQALTEALGQPQAVKYELFGQPLDLDSLDVERDVEEHRVWLAELANLPALSGLPLPRTLDSTTVKVGCFYANLCCEAGRKDTVPARWFDLLEEWASWVDRDALDRPFTQNWFEMHQMLGNWKHHHCRVEQDACADDDVLLLQIGGSQQMAFNPDLEMVTHFVISAAALTRRDFSQVKLYT